MYRIAYNRVAIVPRLGGKLGIVDHVGIGTSGGVFVPFHRTSLVLRRDSSRTGNAHEKERCHKDHRDAYDMYGFVGLQVIDLSNYRNYV